MGRSSDFTIPRIELDRESEVPLRQQLRRQLSLAVRRGSIPRGVRIPSTRLMAKLLQVSRNTVLAAYEDLIEEGLLLAEPGAGVRIAYSAPGGGLSLSGLRHVVREAHFPARVVPVSDPDGNFLYINVK